MKWFSLIFLYLLIKESCVLGHAYFGDVPLSDREEIQEYYEDYLKSSRRIFSLAPHEHVIPRRNNISLSSGVKYYDLNIGNSQHENLFSSKVYQSGFMGNAFASMSTNKFGLGLAIEGGMVEIGYHDERYSGHYSGQKSDINFSGGGVFIYYIPEISFLPNYMTLNMVGGVKYYNVIHDNYGTFYTRESEEVRRYRYSVFKTMVGLDLAILLAKQFWFMPWIHISNHKLNKIKDGNAEYIDDIDNSSLLYDRHFFWTSEPSLTLGLDFALEIFNLEFRLSGLFGFLEGLALGSDRVDDSGLSFSLSYKFKN